MQVGYHAALALIAAAALSLPSLAAEPDGPSSLIMRAESARLTVEDRLSAGPPTSDARKAELDALIKYYTEADQSLLWVDKRRQRTGSKAISLLLQIRKADDYGLPRLRLYPTQF